MRDGWVFLVSMGRKNGKHSSRVETIGTYLVRSERAGSAESAARIPQLANLPQKRVTVIGLGCVGAVIALELAKTGCALCLVDDDEVELAAAVRWPLGIEYLGWEKSEALRHHAMNQWPWAKIESRSHHVGTDYGQDRTIVEASDVVIDATAEIGIQRYLGDLCAASGKPLVIVSSTPGGWGGRIARFFPSRSKAACPVCLWLYEQDKIVTIPPADPLGMFQPIGCRDISFYAPSADTTEISLAATRLAISTLLEGVEGGYPSVPWNFATLVLRCPTGEFIGPKLETWTLPPHSLCQNH